MFSRTRSSSLSWYSSSCENNVMRLLPSPSVFPLGTVKCTTPTFPSTRSLHGHPDSKLRRVSHTFFGLSRTSYLLSMQQPKSYLFQDVSRTMKTDFHLNNHTWHGRFENFAREQQQKQQINLHHRSKPNICSSGSWSMQQSPNVRSKCNLLRSSCIVSRSGKYYNWTEHPFSPFIISEKDMRHLSKIPTNHSSSNSDNEKEEISSKTNNIEPRLQDTELPLWSFFSNKSSVKSPHKWSNPSNFITINLENFMNNSNDTSTDANIKNKTYHNHQPPPLAKILSILIPESKWLLVALGALTVSTAATMQFPNAIGQMIDILSGISAVSDANSFGIVSADISSTEIGSVDTLVRGDARVVTTNESIPAEIIEPMHIIHQDQQLRQMQSIALQMMSYFTIAAFATFAHTSLFDGIGQKIGARLRKQLFTTIIHQDVAFFDQNRAGELSNRLSTDVHEVAEHLVQNIAELLSNVVRSLTAVVSMIALSPILTLYVTPVVPLLWGCAAFYGKFIKDWSKQHLDVLAHSTHVATERFSGIATVLIFGQRAKEVARYSSVIEAAYGYAKRLAVVQGAFYGSSQIVGNITLLGVLWVGTSHVIAGELTPGQLAGFCMYAGHLADSISEMSDNVGGLFKAQGSGARLFSLLDRDSFVDIKDESANELFNTQGQSIILQSNYTPTIRFRNVNFSYPSHPNVPILNEVSFGITNGEMLALTGSSGSGKSSIISLLLRLYDPSQGTITLDGVDIRDLNIEWLRSQIGTVRQEPILFHASIFENVAYGKPDATKNEVIEACIAANIHHFILSLPNGYDTIVGERGASVSGGQKQRLSIARALLTKPRILALDEASSALDASAEQDFLKCLRFLLDSEDNNLSAVLFVTHKKSVLRACDRVVVLSEGRIIEKGTYDFLDMTKGGQLRKLMMDESSDLK